MKRLIVIAVLAFVAASPTTQARTATSYSSRTALIGSPEVLAAARAPAEALRDQSTKVSLLGIRQRVVQAEVQPVSVTLYSTKAAIQGARVAELGLAPLM